MRRINGSALWGIAVSAALGVSAVAAQPADETTLSDDVPLPPRIGDSDAPARPPARPGETRLAPLPEQRADDVEEIVVLGDDNPWRLPDLGSEFRRRQEEERRRGRIQAEFLPLYDPEASFPGTGLLTIDREAQRVGYIQLFRIRFGRRGR